MPLVNPIAAGLRAVSDDGSSDGLPVTDALRQPLGYVQLVLSTGAATALTPPAGANQAEINVEAQALRYRDDGTAPTGTVGMLYGPGTSKVISLTNLTAVQLIAAAPGAIANVSFYRT